MNQPADDNSKFYEEGVHSYEQYTKLAIDTDKRDTAALSRLYWLYGLDEYLQYIEHPQYDIFKRIQSAILYGNIWAIRDLMKNEVYRGPIEHTEEFFDILMSYHTGYNELNHRKVLRYVSHVIDDIFIRKISAWSYKWEEKAILNDHFSRGQISSKLWLVKELKNVANGRLSNGTQFDEIVQYGGWYATVAHFLFREFQIGHYYNLDMDPVSVDIADDFNYEYLLRSWRFKSSCTDVNNIYWLSDNSFHFDVKNKGGKQIKLHTKPDLIINTSCEHMTNDWFYELPDDMLVCLQTNDYFSNEQHINCVKDLEEAKEKYKFSELYYEGELDTHVYKRFMLIGRK